MSHIDDFFDGKFTARNTAPNHYTVPQGTCASLCDHQLCDTLYALTRPLKREPASINANL